MVNIVSAQQSEQAHHEMLNCAMELLESLKLPYRQVYFVQEISVFRHASALIWKSGSPLRRGTGRFPRFQIVGISNHAEQKSVTAIIKANQNTLIPSMDLDWPLGVQLWPFWKTINGPTAR